MRRLYTLLLGLMILSACSKESANNSGGKYFFKYTVEGRTGGYEGTYNILPAPLWVGGIYNALSGSSPTLLADRSVDCNVNGKPPCFNVLISIPTLAKGTYKFGDPEVFLYLKENVYSTISGNSYVINQYSGSGNVVLTLVGDVSGSVNGTFTGQAMKYDYQGNEVKLVPISGSFSLYRAW